MDGIVIDHVSKVFSGLDGTENKVLNDISFTLNPGECIAVTGESGSGKSTLARLILGIIPLSGGEIRIDGNVLSKLSYSEWPEFRRVVQGVFQDTTGSLNSSLSTYKNMEEALCNLTDLSKTMRKNELILLLEKLGISYSLLKTPVRMLSGGEQRRISLLRALSIKPKYLILDEVVSGLDAISCDAVLDTLEEYRKEFGCAYLFITHDLYSAYRIADRIIQIEKGHISKIANKIRGGIT